jgi:hypothetical protein
MQLLLERHGRAGGHPRKYPHPLGEVLWVPASAGMTLRVGLRNAHRPNPELGSDGFSKGRRGNEVEVR